MASTSITINQNYYNVSDPIALIGLKIGLENYFYSFLFKDDTNRLLYSTTDFALQKRSKNSNWDNALLPFMNYREIEISGDNDRTWASYRNLKSGEYIDELGIKVRFTPITFTFDSTLWFATDRDCNIAYQRLIDDNAGESAINYTIKINDVEIPFYGLLEYTGLQFKPNFNENEWLLKNKISTISCNFKVQTFLPMTTKAQTFALTEKVIIDFSNKLLGETDLSVTERYEAILDHFNETISDFNKVPI